MKLVMKTLALATLLFVALTFASAEVYKWTDEKGVVHFGDKAPDDETEPLNEAQLPSINIVPLSPSTQAYYRQNNILPENGEFRSRAHSISGSLLLDGKPIRVERAETVRFWLRNEDSGKEVRFQTSYDVESNYFYIGNVVPGKYGISFAVNKNQSNDRGYPGDYRAWANFSIRDGYSIQRNINLSEIIHLQAPQDNNQFMPGWGNPCDQKKSFASPINFSWKSLGDGVRYAYTVRQNPCEPFQFGEVVASGSTQETYLSLNLSNTERKHQYMFELTAYRGARLIGSLVTHGNTGMGWDYRFLII